MPDLNSMSADDVAIMKGLVEKLELEFGDRLTAQTIESYLSTNYREVSTSARIENFVPLLAERSTRRDLRRLTATDQ